MGRKRQHRLVVRAGIWNVDKRILGRKFCQSTGTAKLEEAGRYLARLEATCQAHVSRGKADA